MKGQSAAPWYTEGPNTPGGRIAECGRPSALPSWVLFAAEVVTPAIARMPGRLAFHRFAFSDDGTNLGNQYLATRGFRPTVELYHYRAFSRNREATVTNPHAIASEAEGGE